MAYNFTAASSQYLSTTSVPVTAAPVTLAFWGKTATTPALDTIGLSIGDGSTHRIQLGVIPGPLRVICTSAGASGASALTSGNWTLNNWFHACGVVSASNNRVAYVNGGGSGLNSGNIPLNAFSEILVGARRNTTPGLYWNGDIAEVGIWNAALTVAEIASLARGMACDKVRPQNLVFYAPIVRDLQDVKGGLTITNTNTATVAAHPRVYA